MKITKIIFFLTTALLLCFNHLYAQNKREAEQKFSKALLYIDEEKYSRALDLLLPLDTILSKHVEAGETFDTTLHVGVKYYIGVAYLNQNGMKTKALPYFEYLLNFKFQNKPVVSHKDLGKLYHLSYEFDRAIYHFTQYLTEIDESHPDFVPIQRMITVCKNAQKAVKRDTVANKIENIGITINTKDSEMNPFVSADDSLLFYTSVRYFESNEQIDSIKRILMSQKKDGTWHTPTEIELSFPNENVDLSLAGLSPSGKMLFIRVLYGNTSDIYICEITGDNCEDLYELNMINSPYWENSASISPDGNEIYFSSNREGGYGGLDLYKVTLNEEGEWEGPFNLGPHINTKYNEDAPFLHPNKKILYFSSEGHNTIGGYDIFKSTLGKDKNWQKPENLGFPVNTPLDNIYFTLSASGEKGYFSCTQFDKYNNQNIYVVNYKDNIPLTLLKGTIKGGTPPRPLEAKIEIIDRKTGETIPYAYTPDPVSGEYFLILPPGKFYDIMFSAEGYLPQVISLYIPNQTYFYQLFQEIYLKSINIFDQAVCEEITVQNTFYDILRVRNKKHDELLSVLQQIIDSNNKCIDRNKAGIIKVHAYSKSDYKANEEYINLRRLIYRATEETDLAFFRILEETTHYDELYSQRFFYKKKNKQEFLIPVDIGDDTIFTRPVLNAYGKNYNQSPLEQRIKGEFQRTRSMEPIVERREYDTTQTRQIFDYTVYFKTKASDIRKKYDEDVDFINDLLIDNPELVVVIEAFSNSIETEEGDLSLAQKRADAVIARFNNRYIQKNQIIKKVRREKTTNTDMREFRRVDVRVFYPYRKWLNGKKR